MYGQQNIKTFNLHSRIQPSSVAFLDAFKQLSGRYLELDNDRIPKNSHLLIPHLWLTCKLPTIKTVLILTRCIEWILHQGFPTSRYRKYRTLATTVTSQIK